MLPPYERMINKAMGLVRLGGKCCAGGRETPFLWPPGPKNTAAGRRLAKLVKKLAPVVAADGIGLNPEPAQAVLAFPRTCP